MKSRGALALAAVLVAALAARPRAAETAPGPGCVTFFGDVLLGRGVARELVHRKVDPWAGLRDSPRLARAWVGNFEGAVRPAQGGSCPRTDGLCLGVEPPALAWLTSSRFRAFSIANNHAGDFGDAGRAATRAALAAQQLVVIDEAPGPTWLDVDGARWAFVALDLAGRPPVERQRAIEAARLQIGLARAQSGRVVVLPHWGREGREWVAPEQEGWATLLRAWGATLIVGTHAHVVQPARCEPGGATYFGLGNHLFDETSAQAREGLALTCCPRGEGFSCAPDRTVRSPTSVVPTLVEAPAPEGAPEGTREACAVDVAAPDRRWLTHLERASLLYVQAFAQAGPNAFFALRRHVSAFDRENALRPYVFRVQDAKGPDRARVVDLWRGTALARPLVAARLFDWRGGQLLCAIHRDDSFLHPRPATTGRVRLVYRWTGFGFAGVDDEAALQACEEL